jgi:hypothetical protein
LNNLVGTQPSGVVRNDNKGPGVLIQNQASFNMIGSAGAGNVISGNDTDGVRITGMGTTGNNIFANMIGVDTLGEPETNLGNGVFIQDAGGNNIGGIFNQNATQIETTAATGNNISDNQETGVVVTGSTATGDSILNNIIAGNPDGTIDLEQGANGRITPPLYSVEEGLFGGGSLTDTAQAVGPQGTYLIEFFSSPTRLADTLRGQAAHFLGANPVTITGNGFAFATLPAPAPGDKYILMTLTDPKGNTSEISFASINGAHIDQGMHLGNPPGSSVKVNPVITVGKILTATDILRINQKTSVSALGAHSEKKGKSGVSKSSNEPTGTVFFEDGNRIVAAAKVMLVRGVGQAQAKLKLTTVGMQTIYAVD